MNASGLPHSEIPGSKPVCGSPELIAAYHVLLRHLSPRHSPYALSSLTIKYENSHRDPNSFCGLSGGMNPSRHTALSVWSEKTTVCRIFSCQRSVGATPRTPRGRSLGQRPRSAPAGSSLSLAALARITRSPLRRLAPFRSPELLILRSRPATDNRVRRFRERGWALGPHPSRRPEAVDNQTKWRIPGSNR